jgi:hypothetical protein
MTTICDTNIKHPGSQQEFNSSRPSGTIRPKINIALNHENENNFAMGKAIKMFLKSGAWHYWN